MEDYSLHQKALIRESIIVNKVLLNRGGVSYAMTFGHLLSLQKYFATQQKLDSEGYFFQSYRQLERQLKCSEEVIREMINKLQADGLIKIKSEKGNATCYYKITNKILEMTNQVVQHKRVTTVDYQEFLPPNNQLSNNINNSSLSLKPDFEELLSEKREALINNKIDINDLIAVISKNRPLKPIEFKALLNHLSTYPEPIMKTSIFVYNALSQIEGITETYKKKQYLKDTLNDYTFNAKIESPPFYNWLEERE